MWPNILFMISRLARFPMNPSKDYYNIVDYVLLYLNDTSLLSLETYCL